MKSLKQDEKYRKNIQRVMEAIRTDEDTAFGMILLTATLMDLCPWESEVAEIVISDCKRNGHVDLCEPEPCKG